MVTRVWVPGFACLCLLWLSQCRYQVLLTLYLLMATRVWEPGATYLTPLPGYTRVLEPGATYLMPTRPGCYLPHSSSWLPGCGYQVLQQILAPSFQVPPPGDAAGSGGQGERHEINHIQESKCNLLIGVFDTIGEQL